MSEGEARWLILQALVEGDEWMPAHEIQLETGLRPMVAEHTLDWLVEAGDIQCRVDGDGVREWKALEP